MSDIQNLTDTKPGDVLAMKNKERGWSGEPAIKHELFTVTRTTEKMVFAVMHDTHSTKEHRFWRDRGAEVGVSYSYAFPATESLIIEHDLQVAMRKRWRDARARMLPIEEAISRRRLDLPQMEALADAWEKFREKRALDL